MSNVLLVRTSMVSELNPYMNHPLGIMYLASVLRENSHQVKIYDLRVEPGGLDVLLKTAKTFQPDIVGISSLTVESGQMEEVADRIKAQFPDKPVLAGGPHATAYPEKVLENKSVDLVVTGEAEKTILELMPYLEKGVIPKDVKGTVCRADGRIIINERQPPIKELDLLPFPSWDLLELKSYSYKRGMSTLSPRPYMTMFTSRGCPFRCIYCHSVFGKGFRARSPENVIEEMETILGNYGIRDFELVDDIFNLDENRVQRICDLIIQKGLKVKLAFPNALRADILTKEVIRSLKKSGTVASAFAIETASPRIQKLIRKNLNLQKAKEAIDYSVDVGILSLGYFMLGFPTESREEVLETIRFATSLKLHSATFFIVTPFFGTEMAEMFKEKYSVLNVKLGDYDYVKGPYNLSDVETTELYRLQRYANIKFFINARRALRIFRSYPDKTLLFRRFVKMVQLKILTKRRGSLVVQ